MKRQAKGENLILSSGLPEQPRSETSSSPRARRFRCALLFVLETECGDELDDLVDGAANGADRCEGILEIVQLRNKCLAVSRSLLERICSGHVIGICEVFRFDRTDLVGD